MSASRISRGFVSAFAVPWNAFVAAFLYFTLLTAATLGGADFSGLTVAVAYLLPFSLYAVLLLSRATQSLGAVAVHIHHTPHAVIR